MAILTKEEHEALLREIAESGGDTPKMLDAMQKLRDEYDERMGELKRYGETYDGENRDRREDENREVDERMDGESKIDWESRYRDLESKYRERFFTTPREVKEEQKEDVIEDGKKKSYEELFEEREG